MHQLRDDPPGDETDRCTAPASPRRLPTLYSAQEVADALGCSLWWVRDRARRGLIPHVRVADAYKFTAGHFAEIVRLHEKRPASRAQPAPCPPTMPPARRSRPAQLLPLALPASAAAREPVEALRARPPRRVSRPERDVA